jgi:type III restriction enzyme
MSALEHALVPPRLDVLDSVEATLELRDPNVVAIRTIAQRLYEHALKAQAGADDFFEGVVDSATGMGKSFIIAGTIDYFAQLGVRNFAVITPGSAIQDKTVNQFTAGHPKSIVEGMEVKPCVVHSGNFTTSSIAADFDDPDKIKLFVFTVQSLLPIGPESKQRRKTRTFHEGLGKEFYEHLSGLDDLIVFADEHHCYGGPEFSNAVRGLTPLALVGLTATPDEKELAKQGVPIIYRFPLAAAISAGYVKTPVIVGRKDDSTDERTQLLDGAALLRAKEAKLAEYHTETGAPLVHPIMLVSCQDTDHAKQTVEFLRSDQFEDGRYATDGAVLEVHSKVKAEKKEAVLAALERVEEPGNPTRIIVQVGMLKEGWDVKNVYVIVSLRTSVSEVLTEQTLGRGLRLPFGQLIDDEAYQYLNELEVVAHERYRDLLKKTNTLTEQFIDYATVIEQPAEVESPASEPTADGHEAETEVGITIITEEGTTAPTAAETGSTAVIVTDTESRKAETTEDAKAKEPLEPSESLAGLVVPKTEVITIPDSVYLSHITEADPFRSVGRAAAVDPEKFLPRTQLTGRVDTEERTATLVTHESNTEIEASEVLTTPAEGSQRIVKLVMESGAAPSRKGVEKQVERLLGYVLEGAGEKADLLLTHYADRVAAKLRQEIIRQLNTLRGTRTVVQKVIKAEVFQPRPRLRREKTSADRKGGKFQKGVAYTGWQRGIYDQAWFDSSPERDMAVILDEEKTAEMWMRLHIKDFPILWAGAEREYNPDFLARTSDGDYWVIEVKDNRHAEDPEVLAKRHAALSWANQVNESASYGTWHYLLVTMDDLENCKGSWTAIVRACSP